MVYEVQKAILADLKCKLPRLSTIIYFTDGCAGQYKNWKKNYNLYQHKSDFGLNARWVFFATCHGKQPCDGIGGTVKRLVSNASLKHDLNNQILSPSHKFQFCKENIWNIIFKFISKADIGNTRVSLNERSKGITQILGTRSFREFSPIDQYSIEMKRTSEDKEPSYVNNFKNQTKQNSVVQVLDYVRCLHDNKWWVSFITNVDNEASKFM